MSSVLNTDVSSNPIRLIGHINRSFARVVDQPMKKLGFAMSQLPVLVNLKRNGPSSQVELAKVAQVEQPSMAQLLTRMERDGLVQRVPDPNDGRSKLISLTKLASQRMPKGKEVMEAASRKALAGFTPNEREQLQALLLRISANLEVVIREEDR
jgi:MarR family transcriptional regulator for hemolysin